MVKVSLIVIHWNTPESLNKQLTLLAQHDKSIEIIIVDNFSEKDVRKKLSIRSSRADRIVLNNENVGFAAAANIGAKLAKGEWLLFLNPDVLMSEESVLEFVEHTESAGLDAASPITDDPNYNKPLPTPWSLTAEFSPLHRIVPQKIFNPSSLIGGCLLIKKTILDGVGGWDEDFFLWFEDSDLTKRLLTKGHKIGRVEATMQHSGGESFKKLPEKKRRELFFQSMKTYAQKHFSRVGKSVVELLSMRFT